MSHQFIDLFLKYLIDCGLESKKKVGYLTECRQAFNSDQPNKERQENKTDNDA